MFCVTSPVIVIERIGLQAFVRSSFLTKGYRWSITGAFLLTFISYLIFAVIAGALISLIVALTGIFGILLSYLVMLTVLAIGIGIFTILSTLIFIRLREIKEGISLEQIADVFD